MRWRNTAVYLVIFLLLGGYYYYFEIVKKEQKEAAEKESRLVFSYNPESVNAIEVVSAGVQPLRLEKQDTWMITQPLRSEVDRPVLDSFLGAIGKLQVMRKVGSAGKLEAYGLADPALTLRIDVGDKKMGLLVGEQNPTGDARYAKTQEGDEVFLIDQLAWGNLNKGLKELRKKELFSWRANQVHAVDIEWRAGEKIRFERRDGGNWGVSDKPDLKIKSEKLENLLDEIHFLRATDFLDESARPNQPEVRLVFHLEGDKTSELTLGNPDPGTRQVLATSPELPVPVKVGSHFFNDLPKTAVALEDRSLLSFSQPEVRELKWKRAGAEGSAVRVDESKWSLGGTAISKPLDDPWPVTVLLEDLSQAEYDEKLEGGTGVPDPAANYLEILGAGGKIASVSWGALPEGEKKEVILRVEKGQEMSFVKVQLENFRHIDEGLGELAKAAAGN